MEYHVLWNGRIYNKYATREKAEIGLARTLAETAAKREARRRSLLEELAELDEPVELTIQEVREYGPDGWYVWDTDDGCLSGPHEDEAEAEEWRDFYISQIAEDQDATAWIGQVTGGIRDESYRP